MGQIAILPWGSFETLLEEPSYKVKRLIINPGCRLSLQKHLLRDEVWAVAGGSGEIEIRFTPETIMKDNRLNFVYIRAGWLHRASCSLLATKPLVIIETQTGECREDDIVRVEDDYGRV